MLTNGQKTYNVVHYCMRRQNSAGRQGSNCKHLSPLKPCRKKILSVSFCGNINVGGMILATSRTAAAAISRMSTQSHKVYV